MRKLVSFFKVIFLIGYIFLLLLVIEAFTRYLFFNTKILSQLYVNDDSWWRFRWIKNKIHDPGDITQNYSVYRYDSKLGWTVKENLKLHYIGKGSYLSTNSKGIRGTKEFSYFKDDTKRRIIATGDSFTFGAEVPDDETFSYFLERFIPNSEVINFAVGGYGHDQMLLKLQEEGYKYKPDIIILGFIGNDKERNILDFRDYWKPRFRLNSGRLELVKNQILRVEDTIRTEYFRLKLGDLLSIIYSKFKYKLGILKDEENKITVAILDEFINLARNLNAKLIFVYLPEGGEITTDKHSSHESFFKGYCESKMGAYDKFSCINARTEFRKQSKEGKKFRNGHFRGHYDRNGHLLIAEVIRNYLRDDSNLTKNN